MCSKKLELESILAYPISVDRTAQETEGVGLNDLQRQVVEYFVDGVRVLGLPRSLGEIYGLLFSSPTALSLDDLVQMLGISKGSASQGLRTLRTLGAVRETIGNCDRRTYYEPATDLKRLVGGFIREQIKPHLKSGKAKLQLLQEAALRDVTPGDQEFYRERINRLESWMKRGGQVLPVLQKLLGQ